MEATQIPGGTAEVDPARVVVSLPRVLDEAWLESSALPFNVSHGVVVRIVCAGTPPRHAEPAALVALAAWAAFVRALGATVEIDDQLRTPYLYHVGLLRGLLRELPWSDEVRTTDNYYPLCRVAGSKRVEELADRVRKCLHIRADDAERGVVYSIGETVRNAEEHAESDLPAIFAAGWFRTQQRFTFAVADTGRGILRSLRAKGVCDLESDDVVAIERALQPFVTGAGRRGVTTAPQNAGMGLFQTRSFSRDSGGRMVIVSGAGGFRESGTAEPAWRVIPAWTGTVVGVTLHPDRLGALALRVGPGSDTTTRSWFCEVAPDGALVLQPPVDGSRFAAHKTWYSEQRPALTAALRSGRLVHVDFGSAVYSTQSALHALLSEPTREFGERIYEMISFRAKGQPLRAVLNLVIAYSLDQVSDGRRER